MVFAYQLHSEAAKEYAEAYEWYERHQKGLGERFIEAVDTRIVQICGQPEYYSSIGNSYRQARVDGFPFTIVYRFYPKKGFVHIASVHHERKHPKKRFRKIE